MDTILILPKASGLNAKTKQALESLLEKYDFAEDWEEPTACSKNLRKDGPTRLFSRDGSMDVIEETMSLATTHGIPLAIHIDGNNEDNTQEWNNKAYITWFDPTTGARYEEAAGTIDVEPLVPLSLAATAATDPEAGKGLLSRIKTLQELGVIRNCPSKAATKSS